MSLRSVGTWNVSFAFIPLEFGHPHEPLEPFTCRTHRFGRGRNYDSMKFLTLAVRSFISKGFARGERRMLSGAHLDGPNPSYIRASRQIHRWNRWVYKSTGQLRLAMGC